MFKTFHLIMGFSAISINYGVQSLDINRNIYYTCPLDKGVVTTKSPWNKVNILIIIIYLALFSTIDLFDHLIE